MSRVEKIYSKIKPDYGNSAFSDPETENKDGVSASLDPETESKDWLSPGIVVLTSSAAGLLPFLSRRLLEEEAIDHAFLSSLMFAFSFASSAMFLRYKRPKYARLMKITAVIWTFSAFALFLSIAQLRNHFWVEEVDLIVTRPICCNPERPSGININGGDVIPFNEANILSFYLGPHPTKTTYSNEDADQSLIISSYPSQSSYPSERKKTRMEPLQSSSERKKTRMEPLQLVDP